MSPVNQVDDLGWELQEYHFDVAAAGPQGLLNRLRERWLNFAARQYVRYLAAQQNQFNQLMAQQLIAQDRERSRLIHDLGALAGQVAGLRQQLAALEARLEAPPPARSDQPEAAAGDRPASRPDTGPTGPAGVQS